jgi:site-specific recombinase XerC
MVQKDGSWQWLLEGFRYELEAQVRPKTVEYYYDHVRVFVRWVEKVGISAPVLLTRRDAHQFFHYVISNPHYANQGNGSGEVARRAESLRFHYYRGLRRFFSWLKIESYIDQSPLDGIVFKPPKESPIEPYQPEHMAKFFAVLDHDWKVARTSRQKMLAARDKAIVCLFLESGLRLQELADLSPTEIDLNERKLVVRYGKLGKSRLCGFGPRTRRAIWHYLGLRPDKVQDNKLWVTEEGRPLSARGIQEIFRRLKRDAGLEHVKGLIHKCRHTFATAGRLHFNLLILSTTINSKSDVDNIHVRFAIS